VSRKNGEKYLEKHYEVDGLYHACVDWLYDNLPEDSPLFVEAERNLNNFLCNVLEGLQEKYPPVKPHLSLVK